MSGAPAATVEAFVALGANLGQAADTVLAAMDAIASMRGVDLLARSSLWASAPIDSTGDDYVNAVVKVSTVLEAQHLLEGLLGIENEAGRQRPYRNAPRTLDLDLLLYGDAIVSTQTLQVPHPRMWERAFVLHPLAEIAPTLVSAAQLEALSSQKLSRLPVVRSLGR